MLDAVGYWHRTIMNGDRFSRLSTKFLLYVTANVAMEEAFKWLVPSGDHLIVLAEMAMSLSAEGPAALPGRVITSAIHYVHRYNKVAGFATHWAWNVWVYTTLQNMLQKSGLIMKTPLSVLIALAIVGNIYTYFVVLAKPQPVEQIDFVQNYEAGRGTVYPDGVHHVQPMTLMTKTVEYKAPPAEAKVKVDINAPMGKNRPLVNLVFGVPVRPPVVYGATFLNELAAVRRCVASGLSAQQFHDAQATQALELKGHTYYGPQEYIGSWFFESQWRRQLDNYGTILDPLPVRTSNLMICDLPDFEDELSYNSEGIYENKEFAAWVARYPLQKQSELLKAAKARAEGSRPIITLKSFVKCEKMTIMDETGMQDRDPRMINATDVTYNEFIGPYINVVSKMFAKYVNPQPFHMNSGRGSPLVKLHVMLDGDYAGLNYWVGLAESLGAVWVEGDVERMDGNYTEDSLSAVHEFYSNIGMWGPVLEYIMEAQHYRQSHTRHGLSFTMEDKRASGEPDTSFGNTVMSIIMALAAVERYTTSHPRKLQQVLLCVLGDDVLIGLIFRFEPIEPRNYADEMRDFATEWRKIARECHFTLKTKYTTELCRAEYLSGVFWPVLKQKVPNLLPEYYEVRDPYIHVALGVKPGRWLARAGWVLDQSGDFEKVLAIFHGALISNDFLTAHVPFVGPMVELLKWKLPKRVIYSAEYDERPMWRLQAPGKLVIDHDYQVARRAFVVRYGILLEQTAELLKAVRDTGLPMFMMHPHVLDMMKRDL